MPGVAGMTGVNDGSHVPPVPNWFQALGHGDSSQKGSARFEEMLPRVNNAKDPCTSTASPRESPRPLDESSTARGDALCKSDEISYEGAYMGSMKHGAGRLRMGGCTYEGDFLNDLMHGNGTLSWDDGRRYRGQFESGKFHGSAVMTWSDGRRYSGQYVEDRKHGEGAFSWQDGRRYLGQWVVGKRHGVGAYTNAKGLTRTGTWQMDRPLHWDFAQDLSGRAHVATVTPALFHA